MMDDGRGTAASKDDSSVVSDTRTTKLRSPYQFGSLTVVPDGRGVPADNTPSEQASGQLKYPDAQEDNKPANQDKRKGLGLSAFEVLVRTLKFKPAMMDEMGDLDEKDVTRELSMLSLASLSKHPTQLALWTRGNTFYSPSNKQAEDYLKEVEVRAAEDPLWFLSPEEREAYEMELQLDQCRLEARQHVTNRNHQGAIEALTQALELDPGRKECLLARAECHMSLEQFNDVIHDCEQYIKLEKTVAKPYVLLGEACYQQCEFEKALSCFYRAKKLRSNSGSTSQFDRYIRKTEDAIFSAVGGDDVTLTTEGDLSYFYEQVENDKSGASPGEDVMGRKHSRWDAQEGQKEEEEEKEQRRKQVPRKTVRQLLGDLYGDYLYLDSFFKDHDDMITAENEKEEKQEEKKRREMEAQDRYYPAIPPHRADGKTNSKRRNRGPRGKQLETTSVLRDLARTELDYLGNRVEYWQQVGKDPPQRNRVLNPGAFDAIGTLEDIARAQDEGEYEEALSMALHAFKKTSRVPTNMLRDVYEFRASLHNLMGISYYEMGKYSRALAQHNQDLNIACTRGLRDCESRALDHIGRTYARMGKYAKAIKSFTLKMPMVQDDIERAWICHELGRCQFEIRKYTESLNYGHKCLSAAEKAEDGSWEMNALILIAQAQIGLKKYSTAREYFTRAAEVAKQEGEHEALGAIESALEQLEGAEDTGSKKPSAKEIRNRIKEVVYEEEEEEHEKQDEESERSDGDNHKDSEEAEEGEERDQRGEENDDREEKEGPDTGPAPTTEAGARDNMAESANEQTDDKDGKAEENDETNKGTTDSRRGDEKEEEEGDEAENGTNQDQKEKGQNKEPTPTPSEIRAKILSANKGTKKEEKDEDDDDFYD